jgi:hypothetical protein
MKVINDDCKNATAQWLARKQHFDWGGYLEQYYNTDRDFLRVNGKPLLMKARSFSFGFTQVQDQETQQSILVQNYPSEIKICLIFDMDSECESFRVQQKTPKWASTYDTFAAYPKQVKLEKNRIRDLRKQREWLPAKYRDLDIYNFNDKDAASAEAATENKEYTCPTRSVSDLAHNLVVYDSEFVGSFVRICFCETHATLLR